MRAQYIRRTLGAAAIFGAGAIAGLSAQTLTDNPHRSELKRADLSGAPGMEVISSIVEVKPGESIDLHFHHGVEAYYALQGGTLEYADGRHVDMVAGTSGMNLRDVKHRGFKNVGDTSAEFFTVHVVDKGRPLYDYSK